MADTDCCGCSNSVVEHETQRADGADHLVGGLVCASDLVVLAWLHRFARKEFGGMSGDLAGFLLQLSELVMLAVLVFATKVVML